MSSLEFIPVKTRVLQPPKDDLLAVLQESMPALKDGDVVVVSSKVVAIHEGRCVLTAEAEKSALVASESELSIPRSYWGTPLTVRHGAFIGTAGIDESNADNHYVLLPEKPFASAELLHVHLTKQFGLTNLGVIIADSHSTPMRRGATGVAIGWWGFEPTINHVGEEDLFGRTLRLEVSNLADGIAAGANVVMGETDECQPIVIARNIPRITFTDKNTKDMLIVLFAEDTFRVLYERWLA